MWYYGSPVIGAVNGINRIFVCKANYVSGTLKVSINGMLYDNDLNADWEELGGKIFKLKRIPVEGDKITASFRVAGPA